MFETFRYGTYCNLFIKAYFNFNSRNLIVTNDGEIVRDYVRNPETASEESRNGQNQPRQGMAQGNNWCQSVASFLASGIDRVAKLKS